MATLFDLTYLATQTATTISCAKVYTTGIRWAVREQAFGGAGHDNVAVLAQKS
jgi:hypothetical protein